MSRDAARAEDGQAAVEFALVVPILMVLVLGLLQALVLGVDAIRVASAAREGARAAAIGRDAEGVTRAALVGGGDLAVERTRVNVPSLPAPSGQPVTVEVVYQPVLFVPGLARLGIEPPEVRVSATMLAE